MLACTQKQRRFVLELQHGPAGYGSEIRAAKAAGYKAGSDGAFSVIAHNTLHHPKVREALREVGYRMIRAASFTSIKNTIARICDLLPPALPPMDSSVDFRLKQFKLTI
jgi:phage terminase small subunit